MTELSAFARLYSELESTTRTSEKIAHLKKYFETAAPEDAAWALYFLSGRKMARLVATRLLREWISEVSQQPLWLVEECYEAVGDLAETVALLLPPGNASTGVLHELVSQKLLPLKSKDDLEKKQALTKILSGLSPIDALVAIKLLTGSLRVGVSKTLVVNALSQVFSITPATMAHRLTGQWNPSASDYLRLVSGESISHDPGKPYPFFLASPLESPLESLGLVSEWLAEWKWDGIRAQIVCREGSVLIWSRGEELVNEAFPELVALGREFPSGTVLDGEILAWRHARPLPFSALQRRLGRKAPPPKLLNEVPVHFKVYDCLELKGADLRERALEDRRVILSGLVASARKGLPLSLSEAISAASWEEIAAEHRLSRGLGVEGIMLKRKSSIYAVGRRRGDWWKWKVDPYRVDAVLMYAQRGHGRRASLYTDYTFGVWDEGKLVPIAKAYSGLTDAEIRKVDQFIRQNTLDRHGPVRVVEPTLVFELAFEGIQESSRHKAKLALRFPRMAHWRHDKKAEEADTLRTLQGLLGAVNESGI